MKVLVMERRKEAPSKPDIRAALVEFQAQLEALSRRQRFTICRPKVMVRPPVSADKHDEENELRLLMRRGGEDVGADSNR